MSGELVPGIERSEEFEVAGEVLADVGATISGEMLSTIEVPRRRGCA